MRQRIQSRVGAVDDILKQISAQGATEQLALYLKSIAVHLQNAQSRYLDDATIAADQAFAEATAALQFIQQHVAHKTSIEELRATEQTRLQIERDELQYAEKKQTASALKDCLEELGFTVDPRKHDDRIVLYAERADHRQVQISIQSEHTSLWDLMEGYQNDSCQQDTQALLGLLRDRHGIHLEPDRVEEEIPIDLSREAKPLEGSNNASMD